MGRTESDRKITSEPWSSWSGSKETNEDHSFAVQRRSVFKKDLTEPTLLEIAGKPVISNDAGPCKSFSLRFFGESNTHFRRRKNCVWFWSLCSSASPYLAQ